MSSSEKKYGLIDPKKKLTVADCFNNDSDSDGGGKRKPYKIDPERGLKKQTIIDMNRALEQDPTVYQYDEVYDSIKQQDKNLKEQKKVDRKPKYMDALINAAERRKKECERRAERLIQKEREAEGDMYKDKEEFITSAYRQKLEEREKEEEELKKMEMIESINDVTKQSDMSSFYRHFYKDTVSDTPPKTDEVATKPVAPALTASSSSSSSDSSQSSSETSSAEENAPEKVEEKTLVDKEVPPSRKPLEDGEIISATEEENKSQSVLEAEKSSGKPAKFSTNKRSYRRRNTSDNEENTITEKKLAEDTHTTQKDRGGYEEHRSAHRDDKERGSKRAEEKRREERRRRSNERKSRDRRHDEDKSRERRRDEEKLRDSRRGQEIHRERYDRHRPQSRRDERKRRSASRDRRHSVSKKSTLPSKDSEDRRTSKRSHDKDDEKFDKRAKKDREVGAEVVKTTETASEKTSFKEVAVEKEGKDNDDSKNTAEKIDIWAKRTIGPVFDECLQRYYRRKAARTAANGS